MGTELKQTKNSFKLIGKVRGIDKDGAYKEEVTNKPGSKRNGETYRSLRFQVETSPTNKITVQMFDYEPTEVFLWNSEKRKADSSYKGDRVPFGQWESQQEMYREQGYAVLQTRVGLTYGEDGKLQSQGLPSFVASQEIYNHLSNGDSVIVEGEIRYGKYKNRNDEEVEQKSYNIKKVFKLKDGIDFESEKFEEVTYFEQELVFVGADIDKKEGKAYVTGRTIDYAKNFHDTQLVVNFKNEDGTGYDAGMVKLAEAFAKRFKFGDVINVFGDTLNRVIVSEEEDTESDKDDLFAEFGGKHKPKHAQTFVARTYVQELSIHGVDAWDKGVYKEDDFQKEELFEKENPFADELGGKNKKKGNNPFDIGEDNDSIDGDDLPF